MEQLNELINSIPRVIMYIIAVVCIGLIVYILTNRTIKVIIKIVLTILLIIILVAIVYYLGIF
jgi:hypothetical protein